MQSTAAAAVSHFSRNFVIRLCAHSHTHTHWETGTHTRMYGHCRVLIDSFMSILNVTVFRATNRWAPQWGIRLIERDHTKRANNHAAHPLCPGGYKPIIGIMTHQQATHPSGVRRDMSTLDPGVLFAMWVNARMHCEALLTLLGSVRHRKYSIGICDIVYWISAIYTYIYIHKYIYILNCILNW